MRSMLRRWVSFLAVMLMIGGFRCVPAAAQEPAGGGAPLVGKGMQPDTVTFDVRDVEVAQLLRALAYHAKRNLIVSPKVKVTVTCRLVDIDAIEAISLLARANGLIVEQHGSVLMVLPDHTQPNRMKITVIPLQNASAEKVAELIKKLSTDKRVQVTHDERTNRLIVATPE